MAVAPVRKLFTVSEYHTMLTAGIFGEDERLELIEGEICEMSPVGSAHASRVKRLAETFLLRLAARATVSVQDPIWLSELSEPQPDIALLKRREDFYASAHPAAPDVLLVVEVADSSPDYDRRVKGPLYAAAGIAEYWILDLTNRALEVYREPSAGGYRDVRRLRRGERLSPAAFPDLDLAVDEILGPTPA